jgi:hypothetical protein
MILVSDYNDADPFLSQDNPNPEGRGKVIITFDKLKQLLHFPEDAEIYGVNMSTNDLSKSQFEVYVKHHDLPKYLEGYEIPRVIPRYGERTRAIDEVVFEGWK